MSSRDGGGLLYLCQSEMCVSGGAASAASSAACLCSFPDIIACRSIHRQRDMYIKACSHNCKARQVQRSQQVIAPERLAGEQLGCCSGGIHHRRRIRHWLRDRSPTRCVHKLLHPAYICAVSHYKQRHLVRQDVGGCTMFLVVQELMEQKLASWEGDNK